MLAAAGAVRYLRAVIRVFAWSVAGLLLLGSCGSDPAAPVDPLDAYVLEEMELGGLPGLAAVLVVGGEVVWEGHYGFADIDSGRAVDAHSLFPVASISKIFTAFPLLIAAERGELDLDAPIDQLAFPLTHPDAPEAAITTRMLLTHTSGYRDDFLKLGQTIYDGDPPIDLETFARGYTQPSGEWYGANNFGRPPGTDYDYCNAGFAIAAHVAEAVWDEDFRSLTQRLAFEPLGFEGTGWLLSDVDADQLALPYSYNSGRDTQTELSNQTGAHYPAGGFRASTSDLVRFVQMFLADGVTADGTRVLSSETIAAMSTPQVPGLSGRQALVLYEQTYNGRTYLGHSGSTFGGSARLLMRPSEDSALIVLTNSDAYVRDRFGLSDGRDALERIIARLENELIARTP